VAAIYYEPEDPSDLTAIGRATLDALAHDLAPPRRHGPRMTMRQCMIIARYVGRDADGAEVNQYVVDYPTGNVTGDDEMNLLSRGIGQGTLGRAYRRADELRDDEF